MLKALYANKASGWPISMYLVIIHELYSMNKSKASTVKVNIATKLRQSYAVCISNNSDTRFVYY